MDVRGTRKVNNLVFENMKYRTKKLRIYHECSELFCKKKSQTFA